MGCDGRAQPVPGAGWQSFACSCCFSGRFFFFFPAEIESQTWHWVTGPRRFLPGFHFHFQRAVPPGPSHRCPGEAGWPWRGSLSPPSAVTPFHCAFLLAGEGLRAAPRPLALTPQSQVSPAKLGGHCRVTPQVPSPLPLPQHAQIASGAC